MGKKMSNKIRNKLILMNNYIGVVFLVITFIATVVQVFCRYVLNKPIAGPEILARYLLIWVTYIGLVKNIKEDNHFRVDYFYNRFPNTIIKWIQFSFDIIILMFLVIIFFSSLKVILFNWGLTESFGIPVNIIYLSVVFTIPLMVVEVIMKIVNSTKTTKNGNN